MRHRTGNDLQGLIMKIMTFGKFKDSFNKVFKDKKTKILAIVGVAGILLLFMGDLFGTGTKNPPASLAGFDNEAYNEQFLQKMHADLTSVISKIEGVGQVEVVVTLETGVQYVYATNNKSASDGTYKSEDEYSTRDSNESSLIIIDGQNGKEPVVLKRIEPTIQGVVVVCEGADNVYVKQAVLNTVTTLCGVTANRVSIAKLVAAQQN